MDKSLGNTIKIEKNDTINISFNIDPQKPRGRGKRFGMRKKPYFLCYKCRAPGHKAANCPQKQIMPNVTNVDETKTDKPEDSDGQIPEKVVDKSNEDRIETPANNKDMDLGV